MEGFLRCAQKYHISKDAVDWFYRLDLHSYLFCRCCRTKKFLAKYSSNYIIFIYKQGNYRPNIPPAQIAIYKLPSAAAGSGYSYVVLLYTPFPLT